MVFPGGITQRYSIFYICFVSYLFVLLFSVLFNIYNYNAYISELKNQKSLYDQMMFQQFDEMINAELTKVDSLLVNVMMDSDILQVVASNDIIAAGQISQTYEAAASMRSYSGEVTNLYIYFESNDAIIMDGAYYRPEKFYQQFVDHAAYEPGGRTSNQHPAAAQQGRHGRPPGAGKQHHYTSFCRYGQGLPNIFA